MKDKDSQLIFEKYITEAFKPAPGSALDGMLNPEDLGLDADLNPLEEWEEHYMGRDLDAIGKLVHFLDSKYEENEHYKLHVGYGDTSPNTVEILGSLRDDADLVELLADAEEEEEGAGLDDFEYEEDEGFASEDDPNPWA